MTKKKTDHDDSADPATGSPGPAALAKAERELRKRAERMVRGKAGKPPENPEARSPEETRRILHDLRVHQIELEMQNEELRRTQMELDAARARYFDLYDLAPVGYCTLSEQGLILEANLIAATLLGVARGELVKQALSRFIVREDQDIYFRHHKQLFETSAPQVCELRMLRRKGSPFMARVEAATAQDADGRRVCRAVMSDITAHHMIEEAFRRKAKDFAPAVGPDPQNLPVKRQEEPVNILLLEDDPAHAEAVQRAFLEAGIKAMIHWAKNLGDYQALAAAHTPDIAIIDLDLPDGNAVRVLTSPPEDGPYPILIMTGHGDERIAVEAMKAGAIDYIEKSSEAFAVLPHTVEHSLHEWNVLQTRKRAESQREAAVERLRRTEENFRRSLDDSPLGARVVTAAGETIYANRELLDFYGYDTAEEFDLRPLQERYTPQSYGEFQIRRKAREKGEFGPREYEIAIVRKNAEIRCLQVFRKEIFWNDEKQFLTLYRDITEEKKKGEAFQQQEATIQGQQTILEQQSSSVEDLIDRLTHSREELAASYEALKANKDDLVRSEKLAFTGRMAAGIAHEIRNPLTNIVLSLRQLKEHDKIKPDGLHYADIMERNSKRIEYLVTELLNCARPIKLNLQPLDIHRNIEDVLSLLKVRLKTQRIKVTKNLTPHPSTLPADKEYLGRVFLNILGNAIEAMPSGGVLSIDTKMEQGRFLIKIKDTGEGISEQNLIRIFDPFFSTKKGGMGLGLSTCQNIVTSHGGLIEVESRGRKGSIFIVSLPQVPNRPIAEKIFKESPNGGTES